MENQGKVELLAPAGSPAAFYGAVNAGADAVYLGGPRFGARAYAENFTEEELVACIRYGHLFGVKIYLAVNTLLKEQELTELPEYLAPFCEAGLDGVIVQDLGALSRIRGSFPGLKLHASTQMTLCSSYGAGLLKAMGASRIVPARELSLNELIEMKQRTGLELETFIHGAMCYCYSGQCLFSSILGGRSGNRGRCAQPCRLPYIVRGSKKETECYPLSLKDLCTVEDIPALVEAGIDSFKIEGRMKKPEYAAGVTAIYRKYIDYYCGLREKIGVEQAKKAYQVTREDRELLSSLYVRNELQDGYYFRRNGRDMVTLTSPAYSSTGEELLRQISHEYLENRPKLKVELEAEFLPEKAAKVIFRCGSEAGEAIGSPVQTAQMQPITEENLRRQLGKLGESPFLATEMHIRLGENVFYPLKEINELRRQAAAALEQALLKSMQPCNECGVNHTKLQDIIRPNQSIFDGAIRPEQSMADNINRPERSTFSGKTPVISVESAASGFLESGLPTAETDLSDQIGQKKQHKYVTSVRTLEQLQALAEFRWKEGRERNPGFSLNRVYVDGDLLLGRQKECMALWAQLMEVAGTEASPPESFAKPRLLASLPYILRETDAPFLEKLWTLAENGIVCGFLVRSLDELGFLLKKERENNRRVELRTDAGVYIWNSETATQMSHMVDGCCFPYELNVSEQRTLLKEAAACGVQISWEKIIYGRIPMMVTANCVRKTTGQCVRDLNADQNKVQNMAQNMTQNAGQNSLLWLKDRYQANFPVVTNCAHCFNTIYNSVPLALFGKQTFRKDVDALRLDFTIESGTELSQVVETCLEEGRLGSGEYTTGHEKRGVE